MGEGFEEDGGGGFGEVAEATGEGVVVDGEG